MPILWKNKLLLLKTESSYGTDPTPTGAANAMLATNVQLTPMDGDDVSRELELPYLGAQAQIPVGLRARLQFRIELVPSGTAGVAPAWGPVMKALGCSETIVTDTSVTYRPVTTGHSSATGWVWHGGQKQVINGMRGSGRMRWPAQGLPYLEADMIGLFSAPTDAAQLSPTYSGFKTPQVVRSAATTFEIDSVPLVMRETTLDLGNQVEPRLLVGSESILITDRAETLSMRVEAPTALSTFDPFAAAEDQDLLPVELVHGVGAGFITTFNAPTVQLRRMSGFENSQNILEWPLEGSPLPNTGNDQWSLALT